MGCRGVLFALTRADVDQLRALGDEATRLEHATEVIEERELGGRTEWAVETDKAWDAIQRSFAGGSLEWEGGTYPLNHVILGGESLYSGEDYIMSLKTPAQVNDICRSLGDVTREEMRRRYFAIDPTDYERSEDDWEYTWDWFTGLVDFYRRAAAAGRFVLFTVDQ
jgi:Domain of unknown function (DUF1877)